MKSPLTGILLIAAFAAVIYLQSPPGPERPAALASIDVPDPLAPSCRCPEGCGCDKDDERPGCHCVVTREAKMTIPELLTFKPEPIFLGNPTTQPLPLNVEPPEPYRRDKPDTTGWTGALVHVSDAGKVDRGEPTWCDPCNRLGTGLNGLRTRSKWKVGLLPENHFRYVTNESEAVPFVEYYVDGELVETLHGYHTARVLVDHHPKVSKTAERIVQAQSAPVVRTVQYETAAGCFGASAAFAPQASGCFGSSSSFAPAAGCFGASSAFAPSYAPAYRTRRVQAYSTPQYCGPDGCYPAQSGLFGGTSQNSYSLIGLNFGVGF